MYETFTPNFKGESGDVVFTSLQNIDKVSLDQIASRLVVMRIRVVRTSFEANTNGKFRILVVPILKSFDRSTRVQTAKSLDLGRYEKVLRMIKVL